MVLTAVILFIPLCVSIVCGVFARELHCMSKEKAFSDYKRRNCKEARNFLLYLIAILMAGGSGFAYISH